MSLPLGRIIVDGVAYANSWTDETIRLRLCPLCDDTGWIKAEEGEPTDVCDCATGAAVAEAMGWGP